MKKKILMSSFIYEINERKLMTDFIKNIFDYENFYDYNYLFRMISNDKEVIFDIYDNVTDNRFNRYVFSFIDKGYDFKVIEEGNVFVNYISVLDVMDSDSKLLKLAYLFKIDDNLMIDYAKSFLDLTFVNILKEIIDK